MPFDRFMPHVFSLVSVQRNAPALPGVYGLSNAREWILIGEADNIKAALFEHLRERSPSMAELSPTGFVYELCVPHNRHARKERLEWEYEPALTQRSR